MKTSPVRSWRNRIAVAAGAFALLCNSSDAATVVWTNTAGGVWKTAVNWSPNRIPGASDDAVINLDGNYTVTVNANGSVRNLTLGGGAGTPTLSITAGTFKISTNAVATILNGAVLNLSGGILDGDGALNVAGTMNWTKGEIRSFVSIAPSGQLNVSSGNFKFLSSGISTTPAPRFGLATALSSWASAPPLPTAEYSRCRTTSPCSQPTKPIS